MVAAMRSPDRAMPLLRQEAGAGEDDDRLIGVQLDLTDAGSISAAAKAIEEAVGAPYALVHNAGISAAGMVEETDMALWQKMFATHVMGPVALTQALLPSMRAAGEGRIVLVASAAGVRGQPATAPYSASKGAMERWGESMACEIAPFGLGVTVLVTGTYDTDIITDAGAIDDRNFDGAYARLHNTMNTRGRFAMSLARPPDVLPADWSRRWTPGRFTAGCRPGCVDVVVVQPGSSGIGMHHMSRIVLGIPRQGSMRGGAWPLTVAQKAMVLAARVIPEPVLKRLASLAARRSKAPKKWD